MVQLFRIGIIGSDSSHAEIFSKLVNIPSPMQEGNYFQDFRVTHIFGIDRVRTEQVVRDGNIENIVGTPEEMFGKVDAVMVVLRHGDLHVKYALPFIKAGIPTWIDKPFTIKKEDAKFLIQVAEEHHTLLTGGSTCKYTDDILMIKNAVEKGSKIGKIKTAILNFPATMNNEYGGLHFYGSHLVEMAMMAFGYDAISVTAFKNNGIVTAIVNYDRYQITLNFIPDLKENEAILFGYNGTMIKEIDITCCYIQGFKNFAEMLRTGKPVIRLDHLYKPVVLLNAILESIETDYQITLSHC